MRRAILAAVVLVYGCGGSSGEAPTETCQMPSDLIVEGDIPPNTAAVLQVAAERCQYPLVGRIAFVATNELPPGTQGTCAREWCAGADIKVDRWWCASDAASWSDCGLAHELGHYCLHTHDEGEATTWGRDVDAEAQARIAGS